MIDWDFIGTLDIIKNGTNPEIWHVKNNTHPGIGWSIKTVIPKIQFSLPDIKPLIYAWVEVCASNTTLVTWTDSAYDWKGNNLDEWQTMWVRDGYDVIQVTDDSITPTLKIVRQTKGQEQIIESIIDNLRSQLVQSTSKNNKDELTELLEIAEALVTQSSDNAVNIRRKNIKVVDAD